MFGIAVAALFVVWKKIVFIKSTFSWGLFDIYICLVKTMVEFVVEQKISLMCLVKNAFQIGVIK